MAFEVDGDGDDGDAEADPMRVSVEKIKPLSSYMLFLLKNINKCIPLLSFFLLFLLDSQISCD